MNVQRLLLLLAVIVVASGADANLEWRGPAAGAERQQRPPQSPPVFRTATNAVTVTVSVMRGRQPVTDLTAPDFVLTDNGVPQVMNSVRADTVPIDVTVAVTGGFQTNREGIVGGVIGADRLADVLRANDRLRLVSVGDRVRSTVIDARQRLADARGREPQIIPGIALVDGLFYALAWPVEPGRRHLVVAFTEGSGRWSTLEPERLAQLADRSDAVLNAALWAAPDDTREVRLPGQSGDTTYGLGRPRMSGGQLAEWRETYEALDEAVRRTGGTMRRLTDSQRAFEEILEDFRQSYVLHYTPTGVESGGWHEIKVSIARPGSYTIRARRGYQGS